jgi:hypothetical protein
VVVDRDRERALGAVLADDVLVEDVVDLLRLREVLELERRRSGQLLIDDLVAEVDALIADVDAGACDQLLDLPLRLAAEAAQQLLIRFGRTCQRNPLLSRCSPAGDPYRTSLGDAMHRPDALNYATGGESPSRMVRARPD